MSLDVLVIIFIIIVIAIFILYPCHIVWLWVAVSNNAASDSLQRPLLWIVYNSGEHLSTIIHLWSVRDDDEMAMMMQFWRTVSPEPRRDFFPVTSASKPYFNWVKYASWSPLQYNTVHSSHTSTVSRVAIRFYFKRFVPLCAQLK